MRTVLTLMLVLFTLSCTSEANQLPVAANTDARMTGEVSRTPTTDWLALRSTERAATVFALQKASATLLPVRLPTETSTATPTFTPAPRLLSPQGPWLLYLHNIPRPAMMDIAEVPAEFILLNQDGSGRTPITLPHIDIDTFLMESENSAKYLAAVGEDIYIFQPSRAAGLRVCRQLLYAGCNTYFRGDEKGGMLASFYQASNDVSPELILYELPGGTIRERFPLVRCSQDTNVCEEFRSNWPEMMRQRPQWSPNGRYLAFVAILDAASSDLFVYDSQNGNLRRMTNGPDWVGPIEWSPDGTHIIMQEILNEFEFLFDPYSKAPTSVWSLSVSTNEIKFLYSTGDAYTIQNILFWLDDKRFISYHGFLVDADQARDLRLVDIEAGTSRILFDGVFVMISFDPIHEVFALYEQNTEYCLPSNICLVSLNDSTIRPLEALPYYISFPWWDENSGLFVSGNDCENDPQSWLAVNYQGTFRCVPKLVRTLTPTPAEPARYPAPNGKWFVSVKDGIWMETAGKPAVPVGQETASDVIWCPDSSCFFFSALQQDQHWNLYRVSLPDLTVKLVDEGIASGGTYQWLGVEH